MIVGAINTAERVLIIAEAGVNHEGDLGRARDMVEAAAKAGADVIKFQTYQTGRLVMRKETARTEQRRKFELSFDDFRALAAHARACNIIFLSTPFDPDSLRLIAELSPALKIASPDFNNVALIKQAIGTRKPLIVSTGMCDEAAIAETLGFIRAEAGEDFLKRSVTLLHCVSSYPAPYTDINLLAVPYLAERFGVEVGYSDHAIGNNMSLAAVALGARIIEKHFTLDKAMTGIRDHKLSADPADLRALVEGIRQIEVARGVAAKRIAPAEKESLYPMRRGLVARTELRAGDTLTEQAVDVLMPCEGLPADRYFWAVGRRLRRDVKEGDAIRLEDLEA